MTRVVAVLGFSHAAHAGLHPVCADRLEAAAAAVRADDVVVLSGWSRTGRSEPEAELMARAWRGANSRVFLDRGARTTAGNAIGIARVARDLGADEVVVVTSGWHARRARALTRAALGGTGVRVRVVTARGEGRPALRLRELAAWSVVPVLALVAARAG